MKDSMFIITNQLLFLTFFYLTIWFFCINWQEHSSVNVDPGKVAAEYYSNITPSDVQEVLDNADSKQQMPTETGALDNILSAKDLDDKFGYKLAAYFVALMTGSYIFTASCDNKCNVYFKHGPNVNRTNHKITKS